jgi:hypothetical protein
MAGPLEIIRYPRFTAPLPLLNLKLWESRMVLKAVKWEYDIDKQSECQHIFNMIFILRDIKGKSIKRIPNPQAPRSNRGRGTKIITMG